MGKLRKARPTAPGTPAGPAAASSTVASSSSPHDSQRRRTPSVASASSHGSTPIALKRAAQVAVSPAVVSAAPSEPVVTSASVVPSFIATPATSTASSPRFYRTRFPSTSTIASSVESAPESFAPSPALAKLRSRLEMNRQESGVRSGGLAAGKSSDAEQGADAREEGLHEPIAREVDDVVSACTREARFVDAGDSHETPARSPDSSIRPLDRPSSQKRLATIPISRTPVPRPLTKPTELVMSAIQLWLGVTLAVLLVVKALVEIALERVSRRRSG